MQVDLAASRDIRKARHHNVIALAFFDITLETVPGLQNYTQ